MIGSLYFWFDDDEPRIDLEWEIEDAIEEHGLMEVISDPIGKLGMELGDLKPFLCNMGYCSYDGGRFLVNQAYACQGKAAQELGVPTPLKYPTRII
jgi:hypothetical protein